jgi:hypothetical protein
VFGCSDSTEPENTSLEADTGGSDGTTGDVGSDGVEAEVTGDGAEADTPVEGDAQGGDAGADSARTCEGDTPASFSLTNTYLRETAIGMGTDGLNYMLGFQGGAGSISAQFVSSEGTSIGSSIATGRTGGSPFVEFDGTHYMLIWPDDENHPNEDIWAMMVSSTGQAVGTAFAVTDTRDIVDSAGLAFGDDVYLVTYLRQGTGDSDSSAVWGTFVGTDGEVGAEVRISEGAGNHVIENVAFDGADFFVVWVDDDNDSNIVGRLVGTDGVLGDTVAITSSGTPVESAVTVAFGGGNYLVVWAAEIGGAESGEWDLFAQRVSPGAGLVGERIDVHTEAGFQSLPFIGVGPERFLVSWTDFADVRDVEQCDLEAEGSCTDLWGQFLGHDGTPRGCAFPIATDPNNQFASPSLFANDRYLVIWNSGDSLEEDDSDLFGAFLEY